MKILALHTGLFPDRQTLDAGVRELEADNDVQRIDLPSNNEDAAAWDDTLTAILAADMILTT